MQDFTVAERNQTLPNKPIRCPDALHCSIAAADWLCKVILAKYTLTPVPHTSGVACNARNKVVRCEFNNV